LRHYDLATIKEDLPAGMMVAILLVPQAIAYAYLAGVPPQYGLYTALIPCLIYAILGTSPHLNIGPVAVSALLVFSGISQIAEPFTQEFVTLAILAGFFIGILQLILGIIRAGTLINLLSYPVITGFTSAASIIVIVNQFKDIFGFEVPSELSLIHKAVHIVTHLPSTHVATLAIGIGTALMISLFKKINKRIPYGLIVVVIGIGLSYLLKFENKGIAVIGHVPDGLPTFSTPVFDVEMIISLIPTIIIVTIVGMIECIGIAKAIEGKHDYYQVRTNQELIAIGTAKIAGSFWSSIPSSGSFSRSALLNESRGKTTMASVFSTVLVVLALLFLTPLLFHLPKVILAVIIVYAVKNLFEWKLAKHLYKEHKKDLIVMLTTFVVALTVGIGIGIGAGFLISFVMVALQSKKPLKALWHILSFDPSKSISKDCSADTARITIVEQLNFGNAEHLKTLSSEILCEVPSINEVILDTKSLYHIDATGCKVIEQLALMAKDRSVKFTVEGSNGHIRKLVDKALGDLPCQHTS